MTAEQMFKELGYEKHENAYVIFYTQDSFLESTIVFGIKHKNIKIYDSKDDRYKTERPKNINLAELKAIIQQCKDLGWLD